MQSQNRIFDDIAKVAGGALGALGNLKQEIEAMVRQRVERFMAEHDLVTREEFEAVKAMAAEARAEQERLKGQIEALQKTAAKPSKPSPDQKSSSTKASRQRATKTSARSVKR
jgi:BMFP domain-containing protein YqiC